MTSVKILIEGYEDINLSKARPTVSLIKDGDIVMVVDPGTIGNKQILIDALQKEGLSVADVNYVCITHSHVDHYLNAGMFPKAKILEYFGIWDGEKFEDWNENFSENIQILKTPGHDETSITLFVKTGEGVVAICGDVFWRENYPEPELDIYASDIKKLEKSRKLIVEISHWIIPGHGGIFKTANGIRIIREKAGKKNNGSNPLIKGRCQKCKKSFKKISDKCFCQEWICYRCCECEPDCNVCNCKHRIKKF